MHIITESIQHLEDLDLQDFVASVKNISSFQASEKLDGAQLWMGLDKSGRLFTSRAGKRAKSENIYDAKKYPEVASSNGFKAAHLALQLKEVDIRNILRPGDTIELEILFGRQPNAITYGLNGKNYIAFLRGVGETPDTMADMLASTLANSTVSVKTDIIDSVDGINLTSSPADLVFQFVEAQKIDTSPIKDTDVQKHLAKLENFLSSFSAVKSIKISNFDLLTRSLSSFPKMHREEIKTEKDKTILRVMNEFKLPIKKELLDKFIRNIKSPLSSVDATADENIGIEGVVLRDPLSKKQIKLVDKDTFSTINQFNHSIRSILTGPVRTTDPTASREMRGGIVGEMNISIADFLGNKDLSRGISAKKLFSIVKGKDAENTVRNLAAELRSEEDYLGTKRKVVAIIDTTIERVLNELSSFKKNKNNFRLKLKSGKELGLSAEVIRRTLVTFAETKKHLEELLERVKKTGSVAQLVAVLYGRHATAVHNPDALSEQLLVEKRQNTDKKLYSGKDAWTLLNTYFAEVMMACVIYKINDMPGVRILRDKTHMRLSSWDKEMSPLNFWGYAIWRAGTPAAKKLIGKGAGEVFKVSRKVPPSHWKFLHLDLSYGREVPVEWEDHRKTMGFLQHYPGLNADRVNKLLDGAFRYNILSFDEKVKFHTKLYFYAQQFSPYSPLIPRMRAIYNQLLVNANEQNYQMVAEMKLHQFISGTVSEDAGATATTAGAVAPAEQSVG